MALHLVTGYSGKAHITSADQGALNAATFGRGNYVLNVGQQFAARVITNNSINVLDGEVIMQGRHIRLESGAYEEVTIENGAQGYFRNDLICIRYTKDSTTGIEEAAFVVIKGNPDASAAVDPAYNNGSILDGILTVDFPLYRVPLNGLNIGDLVALFEVNGSIDERIKALIAGTTPVGNANKLGGKGASEYALGNDVTKRMGWNAVSTSILDLAVSLPSDKNGVYHYYLNSYTGGDLGNANHSYDNATVLVRYGSRIVILWGNDSIKRVAMNYYTGSTWTGWQELATTADLANYVPLSGGTIDGHVGLISSEAVDRIFMLANAKRSISMVTNANGTHYIYDNTNGKFIYDSDANGNTIFNGIASGNLPLSGGKISAKNTTPLIVENNADGATISATAYFAKGSGLGSIGFRAVDTPTMFGMNNSYDILHTGNSAKVSIQESAPTDTSALWVW